MTLTTPDAVRPGSSAGPPDPRFPWKAKGTRKPVTWWERTRYVLLFAVIFEVLVWNEYLQFSPAETWVEAQRQVAWSQQWLLLLAALEVLRQIHLWICTRSARYNRFWSEVVFGRFTRWSQRHFSDWTRYKISTALKVLFLLALLAVVVGKVIGTSPALALFKAPALIWQALPLVLQLGFALAFGILQFVGIFWFVSRGGVETYHPEDVKTRFSDVWGQDHVVDRLKENIVLLERPDDIESRGGHVPSGILLWGPPGTGKTLMAEAVAGETGKPFVFVDPGAFNNMFFGVGILKVKGLFRKLRRLALRYGGVIVFFDEADSLGSRSMTTQGQPGGGFGAGAGMAVARATCSGYDHLSPHARAAVAALSAPDAADPVERGRSRYVMPTNAGGGGMGTLQALLTEMSGLKKPRGFFNRFVRRALLMQPKPPPKYRILIMMATNLPEALDPALRRPGRIDREYRVGYPSKEGRLRTFEGYLSKVQHELTPEQVDKLATITAYATGAKIKDMVNEALVYAIREGHDTITWKDMINAKHLKDLGPSENVEYIERERHAVAIHEACHAVLAWKTRRHMEIDVATIDKGSTYLGMVSSIPPEDQFTQWRSEYESDILVSLASLAGERLFYGGDNSSGVSGDLHSATLIAGLMQSHWGMGPAISSLPALRDLGINSAVPEEKPKGEGGIGFGARLVKREESTGGVLGQRIEADLARLMSQAEEMLEENRAQVLALAHALERHKTLSGDDVVAVLECRAGPIVDGRIYDDPAFVAELEAYHGAAVEAHRRHTAVAAPLPRPRVQSEPEIVQGELVSVDGRSAAASNGSGTSWPPPPPAQASAEEQDVSEREGAGPRE
ncbi:MAG: AAA family ATPase [Kineosporiaceae bacterium]